MAFAIAGELHAWLRLTTAFTAEQTTQAELLLDLAQGVIEDEAGQELESSTDTIVVDGPGRDDREYQAGTGTRKLVLPRWPVTAVESVTLLEDDEVLVHGSTEDYTWSQAGILTRRGAWWPSGDQAVQVIYTAGFLTVPKALKRLCLRLAGAVWDNPAGLTAESLGDHSRKWDAAALGMELSGADRRVIGAYRARTSW